MGHRLRITTLGTMAFLAVACGGRVTETVGTSQQALEALVPLQSCGEVEAYLRTSLQEQINRYFDERIAAVDKGEDYSYGGCGYGYGGADAGASYADDSSGSPSSGNASPSSSDSNGSGSESGATGGASSGGSSSGGDRATDVSGTNNQVAGVDEADFVKNDGQYLYIVENGALRILRAFPVSEAGLVAKVPFEGDPRKLFVEGDRAIVYVATPKSNAAGSGSYGYGSPYSSGECTYGYDCVPSGDGTATKVIVFDITNRAAPQKVREIALSGSLLAARRIGSAIHTVVVDTPPVVEGLEYVPTSLDCSGSYETLKQKKKAAYQALRFKDLSIVAKADLLAQVPTITEDGQSAVGQCGGFYRPGLSEGTTFTSIVSVDIGGGPVTSATIVSDPGVVYASDESLYMSVPHRRDIDGYGSWYPSMEAEKQASTVHQFRIGQTANLTGYEASGIVKGRVLNQFALDEFEGHLRVATTSGQTPDPDVHSTLSILERQGKSLVLTGKVDDIAKTEDIRSVRFDGTRGFVVTFKKTDPLFAFDLSNPSAPKIAGELKIPGFSTYMHMLDESHLLTIGYDAADQGDFAWFTGVMLQIFDVTNMANPTLLHKEVIGTRGSSSEALTNHLAFNYFAKKSLLAIPMTICEGGDANGGYGTTMTFSGLLVYDTTVSGGFHLRGRVAHPNSTPSYGDYGDYDSNGCYNWWSNAGSEVKRSVFMDDFVYSISGRRVKINALSDLSTDLADISLDD